LESTSPTTAIRKVFEVLKFVAGIPTDDSTEDPETIGKNGTVIKNVPTNDRLVRKINNMIIFKK